MENELEIRWKGSKSLAVVVIIYVVDDYDMF